MSIVFALVLLLARGAALVLKWFGERFPLDGTLLKIGAALFVLSRLTAILWPLLYRALASLGVA